MKVLSILNKIFMAICAVCIFVGFYMAFNYISGTNKNMNMFAIFMAVGVFGILGLVFEAILIIRNKNKNNK